MMYPPDVDTAVQLLNQVARTGRRLPSLPAASQPKSVSEALAIQDRLVEQAGQAVAGWKVATSGDGEVMYGTIYAEDCFDSPAVVVRDRYPMMGVEGEVAFRFTQHLSQGEPLSRDEITAVLTPFPAFEIVASRFVDYAATPVLDRLADRMSNGGMVIGRPGGRSIDLSALPVRLSLNAERIVEQVGGHVRGDPLLPVIEFINAMRPRRGFAAGQFITAGTFTGLRFGQPGEVWELQFEGLGEARLTIV